MATTWKRRLRRAGAPLLPFAVAVLLAACSGDFNIRQAMPPDAASTQGQAISDVYTIVFVIGVSIFILVEGLILVAVLRFRRRRNQADLPPQIHGNLTLEVVWTAIPIMIVTFLFFLSWQTLNTISARAAEPPVRIGVIAYQWQWQFVYAPPDISWEDCGAQENTGTCVTVFGTPPANNDRTSWTPPQLHVPLGQTVELQMHSIDVIHSFYVPAFLFQRDITPRADQVVQFTADRLGTYRGQCTQFCGLLHQQMEFQVVVQSPADYQAWLQGALAPVPSPAASPTDGPGGSPAPSGQP